MSNVANSPRPLDQVPKAQGYLPVLGHTLLLLRDLPAVMSSLRSGGNRLQRLQIPGSYDIYVWGDLEAYDLFKNKATSSAHFVEMAEIITGRTAMISSDGAEHHHRRKVADRPFTPQGLKMSGVSAVISEVVEDRIERMIQHSEVVILEETRVLALDIIFRIMGVPPEDLRLWEQNYSTMLNSVPWPKWSIPGSPYHRAAKARAWVDQRLRAYIERARQDPEMTGLVAEFVRGRDDEGKSLNEQEILDNLRLMAFAGHETTASAIAWMASYAAIRPEVHDRLMTEALVAGGLPQTPKEMGDFPYAEALFRECLRLHPPSPMTSRRITEPMVIEGYAIPEGTVVGIPQWLFCRDSSLYNEPERFDPERWLGERRRLTPIETSVFGGGHHFCLGYHMAWVEAVQFIVALMRALHSSGLRMEMQELPRESYFPILRPRMKDTRCTFKKVTTAAGSSA
jgi:cytochrome P450 family 117 subfamily A